MVSTYIGYILAAFTEKLFIMCKKNPAAATQYVALGVCMPLSSRQPKVENRIEVECGKKCILIGIAMIPVQLTVLEKFVVASSYSLQFSFTAFTQLMVNSSICAVVYVV